jgi:metal-sulfur cluster biosynthetic enzyme
MSATSPDDAIMAVLRQVADPEIPAVSVVDLGSCARPRRPV